MVRRELTEISDQIHQMWAEGTSDEQPTEEEIIEMLKKENWMATNINICMDTMMGFYRWTCDIESISTTI